MFYVEYKPKVNTVSFLFNSSTGKRSNYELISRDVSSIRVVDVYDSGYQDWLFVYYNIDIDFNILTYEEWKEGLYDIFMVPFCLVTESLQFNGAVAIADFFPELEYEVINLFHENQMEINNINYRTV